SLAATRCPEMTPLSRLPWNPEPMTYTSSKFGFHGMDRSPIPACPPLSHTSRAFVHAGRGRFHEPNMMAGRSPHAARTSSRAVVSPSFWMVVFFHEADPRGPPPLLWLYPYGGSVTSTSADSQSVISRQSPWYRVTWSSW